MAIVLGTSSGFVIVAPTADPVGSDTTIDGSSVVTKHTAPAGETITITEIGWYRGAGTNTANFEIALYSESAGVAATRLQVDATNSSAVQGWVITAVSWTITAGTAYWLAVQMDAHSGSSSIDSATTGGVGSDVLTSQTALADPYGGGAVGQAAGMYAIYAKISIVRNIAAGVGALTLTGVAPTVFASNNKNIVVDLGVLTLTGIAPTVTVTNNTNISADLGVLTMSGFAPTVAVTNNKNISIDVGGLTVSGFSPTVELPKNLNPSTGLLTVTGFEPTVNVSDHKNINPDFGALIITGFAPSVTTTSGIVADTGQVIITGFAPTINLTTTIFPQTGGLVIQGFAPTVSTPINILPGLGDLILDGFAPVINIGGGEAIVECETGLLFITGYAPTVTGGNKQILPIGSGIDDGGGSSEISDGSLFSTISRVRRKSKIENDI